MFSTQAQNSSQPGLVAIVYEPLPDADQLADPPDYISAGDFGLISDEEFSRFRNLTELSELRSWLSTEFEHRQQILSNLSPAEIVTQLRLPSQERNWFSNAELLNFSRQWLLESGKRYGREDFNASDAESAADLFNKILDQALLDCEMFTRSQVLLFRSTPHSDMIAYEGSGFAISEGTKFPGLTGFSDEGHMVVVFQEVDGTWKVDSANLPSSDQGVDVEPRPDMTWEGVVEESSPAGFLDMFNQITQSTLAIEKIAQEQLTEEREIVTGGLIAIALAIYLYRKHKKSKEKRSLIPASAKKIAPTITARGERADVAALDDGQPLENQAETVADFAQALSAQSEEYQDVLGIEKQLDTELNQVDVKFLDFILDELLDGLELVGNKDLVKFADDGWEQALFSDVTDQIKKMARQFASRMSVNPEKKYQRKNREIWYRQEILFQDINRLIEGREELVIAYLQTCQTELDAELSRVERLGEGSETRKKLEQADKVINALISVLDE